MRDAVTASDAHLLMVSDAVLASAGARFEASRDIAVLAAVLHESDVLAPQRSDRGHFRGAAAARGDAPAGVARAQALQQQLCVASRLCAVYRGILWAGDLPCVVSGPEGWDSDFPTLATVSSAWGGGRAVNVATLPHGGASVLLCMSKALVVGGGGGGDWDRDADELLARWCEHVLAVAAADSSPPADVVEDVELPQTRGFAQTSPIAQFLVVARQVLALYLLSCCVCGVSLADWLCWRGWVCRFQSVAVC
jgi:hypothetical protein